LVWFFVAGRELLDDVCSDWDVTDFCPVEAPFLEGRLEARDA
jgi:hypothetical protein